MQKTVSVGPETKYTEKVRVLAQSYWDNMACKVAWAEKTAVRPLEHIRIRTRIYHLDEALVVYSMHFLVPFPVLLRRNIHYHNIEKMSVCMYVPQ
jgi:hypothetical protein